MNLDLAACNDPHRKLCLSCRYLRYTPYDKGGHMPIGVCERRAPIAGAAGHQFPTFPRVLTYDGCGDYEATSAAVLQERIDAETDRLGRSWANAIRDWNFA
jgi:hypothetical protein